MKNSNKTFTQKLLTVLALALFLGAHGYANDKENGNINNENVKSGTGYAATVNNIPVSHKYGNQSTSKTVILPVEVKNIWNDMPSYDRYGNEITAKARFNMQQNALLNNESKNNAVKNNSASGIIVKEIK